MNKLYKLQQTAARVITGVGLFSFAMAWLIYYGFRVTRSRASTLIITRRSALIQTNVT